MSLDFELGSEVQPTRPQSCSGVREDSFPCCPHWHQHCSVNSEEGNDSAWMIFVPRFFIGLSDQSQELDSGLRGTVVKTVSP